LIFSTQVFVTIKAENYAGKMVSVTSNGVYLSYLSQDLEPLHAIGVHDAHQQAFGDM